MDECDVCGGHGAIYGCGCKSIPDEACDCDGNYLDACGVCGGTTLNSEDCQLVIDIIGNPQKIGNINAYPNPFNSTNSIIIRVREFASVNLDIIDLNGHSIETVFSDQLTDGNIHTLFWNGYQYNSGIYFARLSVNNNSIIHKMILLK